MSHEKALEAAFRVLMDKGAPLPFTYDMEAAIDAYLSALFPDEVAGVAERLIGRAAYERRGGNGTAFQESHNYTAKMMETAASTITALAARAEKAEREAEAWERRAGEAIMGEAAAVERITTLEAENAALRARLEKAGKVIVGLLPESPRDIVNGTRPSFEQCEDARRFLEETK